MGLKKYLPHLKTNPTRVIKFIFENKMQLLLLLAAPIILYYKCLFYEFSPMDEQWLIVRRIDLLKQWSNILASFSEPVGEIYYRPMLNISFIIDAHIGNLNPLVFHLTNLILHVLCVFLVYAVLLALSVERLTALLFSLFFALHPALVHAVVWVPGRNDIMLALFALLSILALINYTQKGKFSFLVLHFLFFALALLTKETAIVLFVIFAFWLYIKNGTNKVFFICLGIWFLMSVILYLLKLNATTFSLSSGNGIFLTATNSVLGLMIFVGKIVFPVKQSIAPTIQNSSVLSGIITLCFFIFLSYRYKFQEKHIAILGTLIFFTCLLIPVWYGASSTLGEQYEHRMYLPMMGAILYLSQLKINFARGIYRNMVVLLIVVLTVKTFSRIDTYKTGFSFVEEGAKHCPTNYLFYFYKGDLLYQKGDAFGAIECYNKAIKLQPRRHILFTNRGNAYASVGNKQMALLDLTTAYNISPQPEILINRFYAYYRFGELEKAKEDLKLLKQIYGENYSPDIPEQARKEMIINRLETFNEMIRKEPLKGILYVNRAKACIELRMGKQALQDLKKACELEPNNADFKRYYTEFSKSFPH